MKLNLDPNWLLLSMKMWREVVEMTIPMRDDIKVHILTKKREHLTNFVQTGKAWRTVLTSCEPAETPEDCAAFVELMTSLDEFLLWAQTSLDQLEKLAIEEVIRDGIEDVMSDPQVWPTIELMLKSLEKKPGQGGKKKPK